MKPYLFSTSSYPNTIHVNPLKISFLEVQIDFSKYDYIILTSKQAVKALHEQNYNEFKDKQALCISKATAQSFEAIKGNILRIGSGYGDNLSEIIALYPKTKRWLYLRAKEVASDFAEISRKDGYRIDEIIVYESQCSKKIQIVELEEKCTLIFTSPSSVKCFLKYHKLKKSYKVVVIGCTTAKALPLDIDFSIAKETSIQSCLKIIN
ncbi:uroporphyrinogen-III synthase [Sulfurimonas sp. SAG-AH-194-C20]|nr:uroporphyrinogen-III synthase [Sulfurimonas sp. SAG-AH-194-C20]MDF1878759.1 uroporphyrinogen-III synthase [Sulfurimonas sp. SAG-AH-194-C20]